MWRRQGFDMNFQWFKWLVWSLLPTAALSQGYPEIQTRPSTMAENCGTQPTPARSSAGQMDEDQVQSLIAELTRMGMHCAAMRIRSNNPLKSRAGPKERAAPVIQSPPKVQAEPAMLERLPRPSRQTGTGQPAAEFIPFKKEEVQTLVSPALPPAQSSQGVELMRDTGGWVHVRGFDIAHSSRFPESELQGLLSSFVDKELNVGQLKHAAGLIAEHYRAKGIVARVLLPQQSLDQGIVKMLVVESQRPKAGNGR
ncbi:MAG: hypothetical protein RL710_2741 [Pseudomonadota bacterium]|jgi:hypothetical protein